MSTDPSPAELHFTINGVQIGSDITLSDQDGQWSQFSASWNSGTSSVATITLVDLNTVAIGNDFALDDVSFSGPAVVPEPSTFTVVSFVPPA